MTQTDNHPRLREHHQLWSLAATVGAIVLYALTNPGFGAQVGVLVVSVALLGVPHGALDDLLGSALLPRRLRKFSVFATLYLAVAAFVVGLWLVAPIVSLATFLALSVLHFGLGDVSPRLKGRRRGLSVAVRGSIPIVLPALFHPAEVSAAFGVLIRAPVSPTLVGGLAAALSVPLLFAWAIELALSARGESRGSQSRGLRRARTSEAADVAELLALPALFLLTGPLFAFAVYFGVWHSGRHVLSLAQRLHASPIRGLARFAAEALPLTLATLTLSAVALATLLALEWTVDVALVSVVFIGLSALTVPHMLLTAVSSRGPLMRRARAWRSYRPTRTTFVPITSSLGGSNP